MVPYDSRSPFLTSGLRFGTAAITTRGAKEDLMETIAEFIDIVLSNADDPETIARVRGQVNELMNEYPMFDIGNSMPPAGWPASRRPPAGRS